MDRPKRSLFPTTPKLALFYCLFAAQTVFAVPDPRDSVIIESKFVQSTTPPSPVYVRVYITNKDTLASFGLALVERSISGGAYLILAKPRTFQNAIHMLDSTMQFFSILATNRYNEVSPDSFSMQGVYDPLDVSTWQPPNATRKALLEIKFDSTRGTGTVHIDSAFILTNPTSGAYVNTRLFRVRPQGGKREVQVNFVKGVVTVDLGGGFETREGIVTMYDLVTALNCIFLGKGDCKGVSTPADFIRLLNALFLTDFHPPPQNTGVDK